MSVSAECFRKTIEVVTYTSVVISVMEEFSDEEDKNADPQRGRKGNLKVYDSAHLAAMLNLNDHRTEKQALRPMKGPKKRPSVKRVVTHGSQWFQSLFHGSRSVLRTWTDLQPAG